MTFQSLALSEADPIKYPICGRSQKGISVAHYSQVSFGLSLDVFIQRSLGTSSEISEDPDSRNLEQISQDIRICV